VGRYAQGEETVVLIVADKIMKERNRIQYQNYERE
jgi:hypothetical protein